MDDDRIGAMVFAVLLVVLIALEIGAAWMSYHTIGEIFSGLMYAALLLNGLAVLLYLSGRRTLAVVAAIALAAALVPYQAALGYRLHHLQIEAGNVVAHLHQARIATGEYPPDLSGYAFLNEQLRSHFHEYTRGDEHGGFLIAWYVGTPSTSHSYTPRGGWQYYPD